jgi:hypothetical protein
MAWGQRELDVGALLLRARASRALHLMPSRKLDGAGCVRLCSALAEAPETLTELDLSGHCIGQEGARAIGRLLAVPGCALERLGVGDAGFGASGVQALAEAVCGVTSSLRTLDLQNRGLDSKAAGTLGSLCSQSLSRLRELKLAFNPLGDTGLGVLLEKAGAGLRLLQTLDVSRTRLTAAGAYSLSNAVSASGACAMPSLFQLDVSFNDITDDGATALALLLRAAAARLTHLRAKACGIGRAGAAVLGEAAGQGGARLRVLDLEENPGMGDAGCAALAEGLQQWVPSSADGGGPAVHTDQDRTTHTTDKPNGSPVVELKLGSCGCADAGAAALSRVVGIECLALPHSGVGAAGLATLLAIRGLRRLQLFDNRAIGRSIDASSHEGTSNSSVNDIGRSIDAGSEGVKSSGKGSENAIGQSIGASSHQGPSNATVNDIRAALHAAETLQDLDLGACALADTSLLAALADASCAPSLACLELNGNPLDSAACVRALATLRERRPELDVVWKAPQGLEPHEMSAVRARASA